MRFCLKCTRFSNATNYREERLFLKHFLEANPKDCAAGQKISQENKSEQPPNILEIKRQMHTLIKSHCLFFNFGFASPLLLSVHINLFPASVNMLGNGFWIVLSLNPIITRLSQSRKSMSWSFGWILACNVFDLERSFQKWESVRNSAPFWSSGSVKRSRRKGPENMFLV